MACSISGVIAWVYVCMFADCVFPALQRVLSNRRGLFANKTSLCQGGAGVLCYLPFFSFQHVLQVTTDKEALATQNALTRLNESGSLRVRLASEDAKALTPQQLATLLMNLDVELSGLL